MIISWELHKPSHLLQLLLQLMQDQSQIVWPIAIQLPLLVVQFQLVTAFNVWVDITQQSLSQQDHGSHNMLSQFAQAQPLEMLPTVLLTQLHSQLPQAKFAWLVLKVTLQTLQVLSVTHAQPLVLHAQLSQLLLQDLSGHGQDQLGLHAQVSVLQSPHVWLQLVEPNTLLDVPLDIILT
jgi:hypothetical protein